jgi:hypothetical protein
MSDDGGNEVRPLPAKRTFVIGRTRGLGVRIA